MAVVRTPSTPTVHQFRGAKRYLVILVFYPGDSHVGVFVGKDATGDPLIIHCASSQNNVVLTGLQGFTSIGRPVYYCESKPRDKPDV